MHALVRWAAEQPHSPCLFVRDVPDWRWLSWRQLADQVARTVETLADAPDAVTFAGTMTPDAIAFDLAVLASQRASRPCADGPRPAPEPVRGRLDRWQPEALPLLSSPGVAWITRGDRSRPVRGAVWQTAVSDLAAILGPARRPDVLVLGGSLAAPSVRLALAWAWHTGAPVVLEPDVEHLVAAVTWARPTVAWLRAEDVAPSLAALAGQGRWRRCRALLVAGAVDDAARRTAETLGIPLVAQAGDTLWQAACPAVEAHGRES